MVLPLTWENISPTILGNRNAVKTMSNKNYLLFCNKIKK